jgi:hypothetical protein
MYEIGTGRQVAGWKKLHVRRSCGFSDWMPSQALRVLERGYEGSLCVQWPAYGLPGKGSLIVVAD